MPRRPPTVPETPYVWVHPGRYSGEPCLGGHRLPTNLVAERAWYFGVEEAMSSWDITFNDVLVCCWFEARHGRRRLRTAWRGWLEEHEGALWSDEWAGVPMPPRRAA